ncbi:hypothetical protein OTU49_001603 [Cherax quadricarinatus]|uniref:Asparagine synthetase domain-containing protein n=1 Tax=Cherax quadricarinatus TaxID=27406 RepID=A0AAW0YA98_CHEQU
MCGICFMCGWSISAQMLQEQVLSCCSSLSNRGPDACAMTLVPITAEVVGLFEGCLLWLQGDQPTTQPLLDHRGNLLLWNGDILAGLQINVSSAELAEERESVIRHLVAPLTSVLDDSIGCALWFGGRGHGAVVGVPYTSPARVLLCGMGADEQLGGYSRHRARFTAAGWSALLEEISLEISRIHTRNLGRDNRILSDHGRAPRFPYLDEDVVNFLNSLPVWIKANLYLPRGVGEKLVLRVAAAHLGLTAAAVLPKRAIQFGSRIAKLENSRERGSDPCVRLVEK